MQKIHFASRLRRQRHIAFFLFFIGRMTACRVPQVAASLTFTTLLALVPVLTVTLAALSAFPVFGNITDATMRFINTMLVPSGADAILGYLDQFKAQASRLTAIGIVFLGVTSLLLIRTIDQTFNHIWRVRAQRPVWLQFLLYWAMLSFAPLLLGLSLTVWGLMLRQGHFNEMFPLLADIIRIGSSIGFNAAILFLLYRFVPNRYVPANHAVVGAGVTAVLLELARTVFSLYVGHFNSYQLIYGAFSAIPLFLLWLHFLWILIIGGAVFTASLSYWQGEAFRRNANERGCFDEILALLVMLYRAQQDGSALSVRDFRKRINMGYDELGDLLDKLARKDYVYLGKQGWVLKTGPQNIELDKLFRSFVYPLSENTAQPENRELCNLLQPCFTNLQCTLADFIRRLPENADAPHA